jgi:cell wall-associated NlpC family hydrolase
VRYVYGHFGVHLAHSSFAQFTSGFRVSRGALKPGDLVFFDGLGHVGIYIGKGRFIHAPHSGTRVRVDPLGGWYTSTYDGARRLAVRHS